VARLAEGSLPEACFRRYLQQDALFLVHFARAYGLAAFKAETIDDLRAAQQGLSAIVDRELGLHIETCAGWGLAPARLFAAEEAEATLAYTRFVLERGLAGDLLDLQVALAPCIVGYAEIGQRLGAETAGRDDHPYRAWIEAYADAAYQAVAATHVAQLDALMARRGGTARLPALITTFTQATRLEAAFWSMALQPDEAAAG
jgi:thiaminase/transcriptional activator TenA